jgi:hypothetical protein
MKLRLSYFLFPVFLVIGYFVLSYFLPKYSGQYVLMVFLFLSDIYLWSSIKKKIFSNTIWLRVTIVSIYWLPLAMVAFIMIGAVFVPITHWNDSFRTLWFGIILVFYMSKLLPVFFLFIADLLRVFHKLGRLFIKSEREQIVKKEEGISRSKFLQYLGFISGGLVMGTMFMGMFKWVYQFTVKDHKIKIKNIPSGIKGFKIVQISDMHLGSWTTQKPLIQAVEMINHLDADIVVFTGDLVNFSTKEAFRFEDTLKQLEARKGVYAILGNHDYGEYIKWPDAESKQKNMDDLFSFYERIGWKLLNNETEILNVNGDNLALIGVENWGANPRFPKLGDLDKAMNGINGKNVKVLLSHDPTHWENIVIPGNYNIDLTLSGHTHGFQFGFESKNFKWSPAKWIYKHWAGLYKDIDTENYLYVNRGIGSIGYPGRIGILPEITILELV